MKLSIPLLKYKINEKIKDKELIMNMIGLYDYPDYIVD